MSDPNFPANLSGPAAYKAALDNALSFRESHGKTLFQARNRVVELEQRDHAIVTLARQLVKELPPEEQAQYLRRFPWLSDGPDPADRQAVICGIMQTFLSNPSLEFTASEIERALGQQGIHANTKRIYNTLNYLAA